MSQSVNPGGNPRLPRWTRPGRQVSSAVGLGVRVPSGSRAPSAATQASEGIGISPLLGGSGAAAVCTASGGGTQQPQRRWNLKEPRPTHVQMLTVGDVGQQVGGLASQAARALSLASPPRAQFHPVLLAAW